MFLGEWGFPPVGVAVRSKKMFLCFHGLWNIVIQCDTISIRFYTCNGWLTLTLDLFNAWVFPCGIGIFSARIASTRHQESGLSLQLHDMRRHCMQTQCSEPPNTSKERICFQFIRNVNANEHDNCSKDILSMKAGTWNTWNNSGVDLITFFSNHCHGPRFSTLLLFCWRISITTAWVAVLFARLPRIDSMEKEERGWEKDGISWNTLTFFPACFFFFCFSMCGNLC